MPPLVTGQEIAQLLSLLGDRDQTFEQLHLRFVAAWGAKVSDRLRASFAVLLLLQDGALRQPTQRFAALHLLHSLTRDQPLGQNPFAPFLAQATQDLLRPERERIFLRLLLSGGTLPEGSIAEIVAGIEHVPVANIPPAEDIWKLLQERDSSRAAEADALGTAPGLPNPGGLSPPFIRPKPPRLPLQPGELRWLHPALPQLVHWDPGLGRDESAVAGLQELLRAAQSGPLLPSQQQQVLAELEADGKLVLLLHLTPASLPDLVEHNPAIAIEVLLRLLQLGHAAEFLPALVAMEMSLHSMEVVNRLSTAINLPLQFVHMYISNCIRSCQSAQDDKYVQTRRVRLVCVFLQSLIRNRIINVQDLFYEIQAFCIEFSRIREAAALFRLLKTLENGDTAPEQPAPGPSDLTTR